MPILDILIGGGLLGLIQFLISRHDSKHGRFKVIQESIDKLFERIDIIDEKGNERNAVEYRVRTLRFEDELLEGRKYSKDSWDQVMGDITGYEQYRESYKEFKNGQTAATIAHIERSYQERLDKHDFV